MKNRRAWVIALLSACALCATGRPSRADAERLRFGFSEIPPYFSMTDGRPSGLLFDVWRTVAAKIGVDFVGVNQPPARLLQSLSNGEVDAALMPIDSAALRRSVLASQEPVEHIILEACNFGAAPLVYSTADIVGKSVIVQQGFSYGGLINFLRDPQNRITIVSAVPQAESGMRMLRAGRADLFVHYRPTIEQLRSKYGWIDLQSTTLARVALHVVLSKTTPNAAGLMARIDAAIDPRLVAP